MSVDLFHILPILAVIMAAVFGFIFWSTWERWHRRAVHKESLLASLHTSKNDLKSTSFLETKIILYMEECTRRSAMGKLKYLCPEILIESSKFPQRAQRAGLSSMVDTRGYEEARARIALCAGLAGAVMGLVVSIPMTLVFSISGILVGWLAPAQVVRQRIEWRTREMERHLPEMLDVIALGMRSGLSFDMSMRLYAGHFDTLLAEDMSIAERTWSTGLERRDEALRTVAQSYASPLFSRVVETIIRSIRFGSSMVEGLEAQSVEARQDYRAQREEQIAKAPVKMMIPTGTLILPAMMILVLGPVMLELVGGGF